MTRDDIIRMAREAGYGDILSMLHSNALERFAKLIAAEIMPKETLAEMFEWGKDAGRREEREKWKWEELHTCHPHCDRPACVAVKRAREDEREMCAAVCDKLGDEFADANAADCAFAIRKRGAP